MCFFFPYNICAFKNDILKHHTYVVYVCFFFLHQSKQKRNLFVLMVSDSGEVSVFLQGYRPLLVLMGNSLMWLHTLLSYMNEFLNAFLHCKHCWHKRALWCIVCTRSERKRETERERVELLWDEVRVQVMKRERERELGCLGWGQGSSNEDMSFVGMVKASKLWHCGDSCL